MSESAPNVGSLVFGGVVAKTVYAAAKLGVVDELADGPLPVDELARRVGANADALARVLRALANEGLFDEPEPRVFAVTEAGRALAAGTREHADALMFVEHVDHAFDHILHSVRTGTSAGELAFGKHYFEWVGGDAEAAAVFNAAMADGARARLPLLVGLDVWRDAQHVVDVGGGSGAAAAALLREHPHLHATVFDLPHVHGDAAAHLAREGVADRAAFVAGDFFESVPRGGDVYVLLQILHDWSDADAERILRSVRAAIPAEGKLVVIEWVTPESGPHRSRWLDVLMLVLLGGRERTEREWRELLGRGGFEIGELVEGDRASAIVARPA